MNYPYPYPNPYAYPPQPPPPPQNHGQFQRLDDKISELERRLGSMGHPSAPPPPTAPTTPASQSYTAPTGFINVNSADEAWETPADWTGAKQWFYNEKTNEIYSKQFDANIPKTIKYVYRAVIDGTDKEAVKDDSDKDNPVIDLISQLKDSISDFDGKFDDIEGQISKLETKIDKIISSAKTAAKPAGGGK